jgi:hypothetical protein
VSRERLDRIRWSADQEVTSERLTPDSTTTTIADYSAVLAHVQRRIVRAERRVKDEEWLENAVDMSYSSAPCTPYRAILPRATKNSAHVARLRHFDLIATAEFRVV